MSKRPKQKPQTVTRDVVLAHLAAHPGATKRDISRALHVQGSDRITLKRILADLADEGTLEKGKKKSYAPAGALADVTVIEISGTDTDGELLGRPANWTRDEAPPKIFVVPGKDEAGPALGVGERVLARLTRTGREYEARVIKRLGASVHRVLGVLKRADKEWRVEPIDRKTKYGFTVDERDLKSARDNELVLVEPLSGRASGLPRGRILERLGSMNEPKAVSLIAIHAHGIPTDFPKDVIAEAEAAMPADPRGRTDLRKIPLITIDPEDARDHDDAVWAGPDTDSANKGGHIVIVAIADVAHYVTPNSGLDRSAYERGNSVYFPDRVVPMLPERLSADLCSLREGEDRPCLAVRMVFDAGGHKRRHEFVRGIMRSAAKLTYAQAQAAFDGRADAKTKPLVANVMQPLWAAYQAAAKARDERSPLDLDLPERRIIIGADGKIASIAFRERLELMRLIEEFMIQANVAAAETLEKARIGFIYRVHEEPSAEKLAAFADYLKSINIPFAKGQVVKPGVFNRILQRVKGTVHEHVLNEVTLRTQAQAVYAPENVGHFGLNLAKYAHFTSPIRRYADLVVHRALIRALKIGEGGLSDSELTRLAETAAHISMTERRAMTAERDSVDRYVAAFMEDRIGAVFEGRISGVTRFGLFVRLKETGADGLLPMRALGTEFFRHDEKRHALVGSRTHFAYKLGDPVSVRLAEAAPLTGGLRFDLASASTREQPAKRNMPATADELAAIYLDEGGVVHGPTMRPKDAATLIVVRRDADGPRVLMGERHQRHVFQPGKLVFPGGRLDPGDQRLSLTQDLQPHVLARAAMGGTSGRARGLALASIRETFEETGVLMGEESAAAPRTRSPSWRKFFAHGIVPRLDAIDFIGRAITPPGRPRRYDTRFFMTDASAIARTLDAEHRSDELLDPVWLTLDEARAARIMGITRLMLDEVEARLTDGPDPARPAPFFAMRRGKPHISWL